LKQVQTDLQAVLSINADVELVEFGTLPRSEVGKARRVIDLRKEQPQA
jgi:phenylacetate-coenzyme A ligase PaaK-like adenylate-forming protein